MADFSRRFGVGLVALCSIGTAMSFASRAQAQTVVSGTAVTVSADATDNVGVVGVQFLLDGVSLGTEDTAAPWTMSWNSTTAADGIHQLTARARDAAGNQATSAPVVVTVNNSGSGGGGGDTIPPAVTATGPANGSTVSGSISLAASATDNVGVVGVQFLLDGAPLAAEDLIPPYDIVFDTTVVADGFHTFAARARDAAGNQAISSLGLILANGGGDPLPDPDPDGSVDETAPSQGVGTMELTVEPSTPGFRQIRANADATGVEQLEIHIDGQLTATVPGNSATYEWDVRPLVGAHEIRVSGLDVSGTAVLASSSLFYSPNSVHVPSVTLDVVEFGIIGATFIQGLADVTGVGRLELYIDRELRLAELGEEMEFAWTPEPGVNHELLFVAYDSTGVAASVSVSYGP